MAATGAQRAVMRLTSGMVRNQRDCGPEDGCRPIVVQAGGSLTGWCRCGLIKRSDLRPSKQPVKPSTRLSAEIAGNFAGDPTTLEAPG